MSTINICWFRRDLRLNDNAALYHALKSGKKVLPLFIFDQNILEKLEDKDDARVTFLHQQIGELQEQLKELGSHLMVLYGRPKKIWAQLLNDNVINTVYCNHDFEPYALKRDQEIKKMLLSADIKFLSFKDHVIFEKDEILKDNGEPYMVFTPYSKKWKAKLKTKLEKQGKKEVSYYLKSYPCNKYYSNLKTGKSKIPSLEFMGFKPSKIAFPTTEVSRKIIKNYGEQRNFPGIPGTSKLGLHFRFGTISIREKARAAEPLSEIYLNELIWRDFYAMILSHFPHVIGSPFRKKYENIPWRNAEEDYKKWCEGQTGYPLVDAGMRELNATGFMHNRVRMLTASFLTKHLLIDWRLGEAYFARKLLDFDLASNNGGWQWAAGCGTDAAPYFRIFSPDAQMKKFDKDLRYIKKWVPEYGTAEYVDPIVDHKFARERCLSTYKKALNNL